MTALPTAPSPAASGPSRRAALGIAAGGGIALTALGRATPAQAAPVHPMSPVLPAVIGDLAKSLDLASSKEWHLARRACPAPTKAIVADIKKLGTTAWIDKQLAWTTISDKTADKLIKKHLSFTTMTASQLVKASNNEAWRGGKALSISRTIRQVFTKRYLYESMVDTMADHLYVCADGKAGHLAAWFDWAVIRKHALGKFSDMLYAAVRHPGLLVYLDNQYNSADNPNENLGRELLELHTVGVEDADGNPRYTEDDVRSSALLLTGHGIKAWNKLTYKFRPEEHHFGELTILGKTYPNAEGEGPATLKAYLYDLAHHRGTAEHIARRLATRFVSDTPSDALVTKLANVYEANDTSLAAVLRALLLSDEFADEVGSKWRRPQETMATMIKARRPYTIKTGKGETQTKNLWSITGTVQWLLYLEGHEPRMWPVVNGYPDKAGAWMGTAALLSSWYSANARTNWGKDEDWPSKSGSWRTALGLKTGMLASDAAKKITRDLTGFTWTQEHLDIVVARLKGDATVDTLTADQLKYNLGLALDFVFCSPYFKLR